MPHPLIEVLRRPLEFALRSAVGVVNKLLAGGSAVLDGHADRVEDQLGA